MHKVLHGGVHRLKHLLPGSSPIPRNGHRGEVFETIIGPRRGPCSFMALCSLSLTFKQDIETSALAV